MEKIVVLRARKISSDTVYAIQTRDETYLADGIVHHNCQLCNRYKNGNYKVYEKKIKMELGEDEVLKLWDKAYDKRKIPTYELEEMLVEIKQKYKDLIHDRKEKGYKC